MKRIITAILSGIIRSDIKRIKMLKGRMETAVSAQGDYDNDAH